MRAALLAALAVVLLALAACASDPNPSDANPSDAKRPDLGVSPVVPYQIEGGKGWR